MSTFIVVGYYTMNPPYELYSRTFIKSMNQLNIPFYVEAIDSLGSWYNNINFKPTFIKKMLKRFSSLNIIYVDCDAEFLRYPKLFKILGDDEKCNIGVHYFDRSYHGHNQIGFEVLSGTIFFKNNSQVSNLVDNWEKECQRKPHVWDQKSLEKILKGQFYNLPEEYCTIFDTMEHVKKPVIIHYQASREFRKKKIKDLRRRALPFPKVVS